MGYIFRAICNASVALNWGSALSESTRSGRNVSTSYIKYALLTASLTFNGCRFFLSAGAVLFRHRCAVFQHQDLKGFLHFLETINGVLDSATANTSQYFLLQCKIFKIYWLNNVTVGTQFIALLNVGVFFG